MGKDRYAVVQSSDHGVTRMVERTAADERMLVCDIYDPALRLRALDIVSAACGR